MKNENLKPIVFPNNADSNSRSSSYYKENKYAQNLLLKALASGITDPNELKKIAGLKKVTEVYRTLDKMQIRREYHIALEKAGMSLDFLVGEIKALCSGDSVSDKIKLGALQTILKSIGLDKYEKEENTGKNWEEIILEIVDKKEKGEIKEGEFEEGIGDYKVNTPTVPDDVKERQKIEKKEAEELYD